MFRPMKATFRENYKILPEGGLRGPEYIVKILRNKKNIFFRNICQITWDKYYIQSISIDIIARDTVE
jgi:hypothetical protein